MEHREWLENIDAYIDGELAQEARARVEQHLTACADCAAALERWKSFSTALLRPDPVPNTEAFVTRIMARLEEKQESAGPLAWLFDWRMSAVALTALVGLFYTLATPTENPSVSALLLSGSSDAVAMLASDAPDDEDVLQLAVVRS